MSTLGRTGTNFLFGAAGAALGGVLHYAAALLIARSLGPAVFGRYMFLLSAGYLIALVLQAVPFALNAGSGFRHHGRLRRRIALGLADPVVANRIWLWAMTSAVVVLQYAYSIASAAFGFGTDPRSSGAVIGTLGLTLSVLLALAFLPPQRYLRWLAARNSPARM